MTILHVITGLNTGGAETALCRLLESLRPPKFKHVVVALGPEGALSTRVCEAAALYHLGMRAGRLSPNDVLRLRSILRRVQPDVIQGWMNHANFMTTLAGIGLRVPVVWGIRQTLYSLEHEKTSARWVIRACARLSRRPAWIVYNSQLSRTQHVKLGFHDSRTLVIPNGFDTRAFMPNPDARSRVRAELGIPEDAVAIGLVARMHPMKDHANFLHAAARFVTGHTNAEFVLVGDGVDESSPELMRLVNELQLQSKVHLCGRRMDIAAINNALDVASLSSAWGEGCPNAIGEAMACGTPCVATDIGDVRVIIGETGVVIPPRDPDALCEGWSKLLVLGTEGRHTLGERARQRIVDHYSLAANSDRYAELYRSLACSGEVAVMDFRETGK